MSSPNPQRRKQSSRDDFDVAQLASPAARCLTGSSGRAVASLGTLVPFENNPRNPDDFDPEKSLAFSSLLNSIDQAGVREPIYVFPGHDGNLHMQNGHRRRRCVMLINDRREAAYQAQLKLGNLRQATHAPTS